MEICGFFIEDIQMVSYNRVVFAHFITNSWYSGLGFNATYRHTLGRVRKLLLSVVALKVKKTNLKPKNWCNHNCA